MYMYPLVFRCTCEIEPESQLPIEQTLAEEARDVAMMLLQEYYLLHVPSPYPETNAIIVRICTLSNSNRFDPYTERLGNIFTNFIEGELKK